MAVHNFKRKNVVTDVIGSIDIRWKDQVYDLWLTNIPQHLNSHDALCITFHKRHCDIASIVNETRYNLIIDYKYKNDLVESYTIWIYFLVLQFMYLFEETQTYVTRN